MLVLKMKWLNIAVVCLLFFVIKCMGMSISEIEDFSNFLKKTSQLDEPLKKGTNPDYDSDDEVVSDHAWEASGKFEGDLILNERQRRLIVEDVAQGLSRNGLKDSTKRWPNNEVTYYIQREHFTEDQVQAIMDGIDDLSRASCVKFKPYRKGDRDAVVIQGSRRGCFSQVGYQSGYQVLNLSGRHPVGRGCFRHGTVVHELLHTLGFYHMQSSADRDDYIDVRWENIIDQARHNFRKYNAFTVSDFGVGYDYESVLHYSKGAFSKNGRPTLIPKMSGASIGQRVGLSDKDTQKLNKMYCDADSSNFEASEEDTTKKATTEKKSSKNKPFEGQGIGYHQGKTVVIKLPAAETYKLPDSPAFHKFDYFSKAPETMSPTLAEGFGAGKEIEYSYKLPAAFNTDEYEQTTKLHTNIDDYSYNRQPENAYGENDLNKLPELKKPSVKENEHEKEQSYEITKGLSQDAESPRGHSVKYSDDLNEAFERLGKIIRTHVYPSQTPNLSVYRTIPDYSDFYRTEKKEPKPDIVKGDEAFPTSSLPNKITRDETYYSKGLYPKTPHPFVKSLYSSDSSSQKKIYNGNAANSPEEENSSTDVDEDTTKEVDLSYRTSSPLKQMYKVKEDNVLTPEFAKLEHLVYNHNLSSLYNPKTVKSNDKSLDRKQTIFGYVVPLGDEQDNPERINEKHTLYKYTYPEERSDYDEHPSKKYNNYSGPENEGYGSPSSGKKAYSLFGVLVPLAKDWHKDFDHHKGSHYSDDYKPNEDFR